MFGHKGWVEVLRIKILQSEKSIVPMKCFPELKCISMLKRDMVKIGSSSGIWLIAVSKRSGENV